VVSTHLKNITQIGNLPQIGMNIEIFGLPPPRYVGPCPLQVFSAPMVFAREFFGEMVFPHQGLVLQQ